MAKAPYPITVRKGRYATLKFKIVDQKPCASVGAAAFVITKPSGRIVKTMQPKKWYSKNSLHGYRFRCSLARGTYYFWVFATDGAGNDDRTPARNKLIVKYAEPSVRRVRRGRSGVGALPRRQATA